MSNDENNNKSPEGILATIFKEIKRNIPLQIFVRGIEMYLNKRSNLAFNIKERSSARGTLKKELEKDTMTWKVFIKGLEIIGAEKLEITFKIIGQNGRIEEYQKSILFANPTKDDDVNN